jgi:tetratricopeptide (TPR) repeat protein
MRQPVFLNTLFALSVCSASLASTDLYADGVAFYKKRDYKQALEQFSSVYAKDPSNANAIYYAAHCNLALGNQNAAVRLYKLLVKQHASSTVAAPAQDVLRRLKIDLSEQSAKPPTAGPKEAKTTDKKTLIAALVKTVRATADRPEVSQSLVTEMKETLNGYPIGVLQLLTERNCKIFLTPTLIDKEPELVNTQPSGYEEGTTYRNCPGCFSSGQIVICEYTFIGDSDNLRPQKDTVSTLRHEIGHAIDYCLGGYSMTTEFKHAHALDTGAMDEDAKPQLAYYLQKDVTGAVETFAELVCAKLGGGKARSRSSNVETHFTRCSVLVDKVLSKYTI